MEYADLLESEDLDLEVLGKEVNEEQLKKIGVRTLGQRIRILQAAKDARVRSDAVRLDAVRSDGKGKGHSSAQTVGRQKKATVMIAESGADEGGKKDSEADLETLGQRIRIIQAAKDARVRLDGKGKEQSTEQTESTVLGRQKKATVIIAQSGADEGGRKDSKADVERKRLEEKFETFMKNHHEGGGGGGFSKAAASKKPSDSSKDSSEKWMLFTALM